MKKKDENPLEGPMEYVMGQATQVVTEALEEIGRKDVRIKKVLIEAEEEIGQSTTPGYWVWVFLHEGRGRNPNSVFTKFRSLDRMKINLKEEVETEYNPKTA